MKWHEPADPSGPTLPRRALLSSPKQLYSNRCEYCCLSDEHAPFFFLFSFCADLVQEVCCLLSQMLQSVIVTRFGHFEMLHEKFSSE